MTAGQCAGSRVAAPAASSLFMKFGKSGDSSLDTDLISD